MNTTQRQDPLHFLAHVITDLVDSRADMSPEPQPAGPRYDTQTSSPLTSSDRGVASLHIPCGPSASTAPPEHKPLKRSGTSNSFQSRDSTPRESRQSTKRQKTTGKVSRSHLKAIMEMQSRRKELLERARKIKTIDNSPVNNNQLLVLRMVYDEITMYPSEAWMVLIAIIIRRAFKQIKNWFSNERQKNKGGEVVLANTDLGDKMRLRPAALQLCQEWSDAFF